jgi:vacuolar-type H+-ATPase subunit C/Vma6
VSGSPYAAPLGRFKAVAPELLPKELYAALATATEIDDVAKLLEPTVYGPEIAQASATYAGVTRLEVAINRLFVRRNRSVLEAAPFAGKALILAYLQRWDVENISAILSAKAQGRTLAETEAFLVSDRSLPAGLMAGALTLDDYRLLLQQTTIESIASQLVRFGYGGTLIPQLDAYDRSHDIFPLLHALWTQYYETLLSSSRFFQGDEWVVREFLRSEIDVRNVLLLLKGKNASLPVEAVLDRFIEGGNLPRAEAADLYGAPGVEELVGALGPRFPELAEALPAFKGDPTLVPFELMLVRERSIREMKRLRSYPMSVAVLFDYLLHAELERSDLRRIIYGKQYSVATEAIAASLVVPRL